MTVNAGIIVSVAGDELLQFGGCFRKILDMKATSSIRQVVPEGRVPPTDGKYLPELPSILNILRVDP